MSLCAGISRHFNLAPEVALININTNWSNFMSYNPYKSFDDYAFWKNGVEKSNINFPENIYNPKWKIGDKDKIATIGSCFAQHIAKWLRENGFNVPFYETDGFKEDQQMFSANYGNVYTVRQALQLIQESAKERTPSEVAWESGDKFIDAMRPNSIKGGFSSPEEVVNARKSHLYAVNKMVKDFDVLIFTLGLTESWQIEKCKTILPTAPGVLGGKFDPDQYRFLNFKYNEIMDDLHELCDLLKRLRGNREFKLLLTVSPVPLTATASGNHVLLASTYSKAVLRSVAGDFADKHSFAEYFPSYEIVTNPAARSNFFEDNLRSVKMSTVENVMNVFSSLALDNPVSSSNSGDKFDPDCEDALLEEFEKKNDVPEASTDIVCVGDSHLVSFRNNLIPKVPSAYFFPSYWAEFPWTEFKRNNYLSHFLVKDQYGHLIKEVSIEDKKTLVLIGMGIGGDNIIRCHGDLGRESSPRVPIKSEVDESLVKFYKKHIREKLEQQRIKELDENSTYENIFWIASPDMCLSRAEFRFGEAFVNSGSYLIHKMAYSQAFDEYINTINLKKIRVMFHDNSLCDPKTGFTLDDYLISDNPWDIHCNSDYYELITNKILSLT